MLVDAGAYIDFSVHDSCHDNLERALLERVYFVQRNGVFTRPPLPKPNLIRKSLSEFSKLMRKKLPSLTPWSMEQFVDSYSGHKRVIYAKAAESLTVTGVTRKDSYISAFVKAEKVNFTSKPDPAPRVIQPRSPRYNVAVGMYIRPIEHIIYCKIASIFGAPTVAKGYNADRMGALFAAKWKKYSKPVAVGLDASRFDQHISVDALKWEHSIYLAAYQNDPELRKLLGWQLSNTGFGRTSDGTIKYTTEGCRMSGDMNTALGNCLIMCALVWAYFKSIGVAVDLVNNGDDCVVIFESGFLSRLESLPTWFENHGFTMKVEPPVYRLEEIEFCQMHPIQFEPTRWTMMRDPRVCVSKDLLSVKNVSTEGAWKFYMQAISDCGQACAGDLPIVGAMYQMMDVGGKKKVGKGPETGFEYLAMNMTRTFGEPTPLSRYSVYLAFGIRPDRQVALEQWYRSGGLQYDPRPVDVFKRNPELYEL